MWRLAINPGAADDLKRLDPFVGKRILFKLNWVASNFDVMHPARLHHALRDSSKVRVGDWRATYDVDYAEQILILQTVDHRSKIYRRKKK